MSRMSCSEKSGVCIIETKSQTAISRGILGSKSTTSHGNKFTSRLRVRKSSFGYGGVLGVGRMAERSSMVAPEYKRPPLLFLNTYQLDPLTPYHIPSVVKAINGLLDENFGNHRYSPQESPALALRISGELLRTIKTFCFNRYRIITVVTIAQKRAQSYNNAIAFLWDHERDRSVNENRETSTAFIQVTVFGVYLD